MRNFLLNEKSPTNNNPDYLIPKRFENSLLSHLLGNIMSIEGFPLMLGIHGPSGHGKSFQCTKLLEQWGVIVQHISGSLLENSAAGGPSRIIREEYKTAHQKSESLGLPSCILIDDIDAGIGDFGKDVTYTVNRQNVSATLMNLCDHPTILDSETVQRSAIIVTANELKTLYPPLIRPQRMTLVHWEMSLQEKQEIANQIFFDILPEKIIEMLVNKFENESISFFSQIRSEYYSFVLLEYSNQNKKGNLLRNLFLDPNKQQILKQKILNNKKSNSEMINNIASNVLIQRQALDSVNKTNGSAI